MRFPHRLVLAALAVLGSASAAHAQTIVNTGDDLAALIAAAANGDVLEFHTDATFTGMFDWAGKQLTFQAAAGFAPTLRGPDGQNCIVTSPGIPATGGTFKGLRIEAGTPTPFEPFPVSVQANGAPGAALDLVFEDCTFEGRPTFNGNGPAAVTGTFKGCTFEDNFLATGALTVPLEVVVEDCVAEEVLQVICLPIAGTPTFADVTIRRSLFGRGIELSGAGGGLLTALVESSVVDGDLEPGTFVPYGVRLFDNVIGTIANLTITNCSNGIEGEPGVTWNNMLIAGNFGPSLSDVPAANISHSLIEDGTYDGVNSNFTGLAVWDDAYQLVACSAGLDAGDNSVAGLGATDLNGAPRVQDNDPLVGAIVNVGATESTGTLAASATVENGSGINPTTYIAGTLPVVGGTYQALILTPPGAMPAATVIVVDAPAPPTTSPAWVGELMVALSGAAIYDVEAGAVHNIPVPSNCALVGLTVPTQGFALYDEGGPLVPHCYNRLDLVIGG